MYYVTSEFSKHLFCFFGCVWYMLSSRVILGLTKFLLWTDHFLQCCFLQRYLHTLWLLEVTFPSSFGQCEFFSLSLGFRCKAFLQLGLRTGLWGKREKKKTLLGPWGPLFPSLWLEWGFLSDSPPTGRRWDLKEGKTKRQTHSCNRVFIIQGWLAVSPQ